MNSLGNPKYINYKGETVNYSRFNYSTFIKKDIISIRGAIPDNYGLWLTVLSIIGFIAMLLFDKKIAFYLLKRSIARKRNSSENITPDNIRENDKPRMKNLLYMILAVLLLLASENLLVYQMVGILDIKYLELFQKVYDILWWLVPAYFITRIIEFYLWLPLERKSKQVIPEVVRKMTNFVIFLLAIFGIVSFVFGKALTGLLATTGMTAMIIGLAVQMNISNVFSGIALNLERPFRVGDWVKIATYDAGKVTDISWRTTKLQDVSGHNWNVPNAYVSESNIINYSYPNNQIFLSHAIPIDLKYKPDLINNLLIEAVSKVEEANEPASRLDGFTEYCANYLVIYQTDDYGKKNELKKQVIKSIWEHLSNNGITPAIRREEIMLVDSGNHQKEENIQIDTEEPKRKNHKFLNKFLK
ncbi:MAG: mechanosensitive ion channel [Caldithrix sp.]|nr:mechanosensitive ion channel [Caldithrix sp.]